MNNLHSLYLVAINLGCDIAEYNDHFNHNTQSSIYLAQRIGLPLHYRFKFYKNRFYSADLQSDLYSFLEQSEHIISQSKDLKIASKYTNIINDILYLKKYTPARMNVPDWLDVIATIDYMYLSNSRNHDDISKYIEPHADQFYYAMSKINQTRLGKWRNDY